MEENGHFTPDQSGFLRQRFTLACLLKMSDDWYNGLDLGKLVGLVFIDLERDLIQLITIFSVNSFNFTASNTENSPGFSLTQPFVSNFVGLLVLILTLRK